MSSAFGGYYDRVDVTADTVFDIIVAHLRNTLGLDKKTCYETISPLSAPFNPKSGEYFVTVSPGEGNFLPEEQVEDNISEESNVRVAGYTRILTDSLEHDYQRLHDDARGLHTIKHNILKALCGQDLPVTDDDRFLRQPIFCTHCSAPERGKIQGESYEIARIILTFGVDFDWDIS